MNKTNTINTTTKTNTNSNVTPRTVFAERQAQASFQRYVQRVAFQLTLSAPMIACLKYVRDDPGFDGSDPTERNKERNNIVAFNTQASLFITEMKALERRGLVWFDEPDGKVRKWWQPGDKYHKLTRIGELTCELLVEAGMMPAKETEIVPRKKRA